MHAHSRAVNSEFGVISRPRSTDPKGWIGTEGERYVFFLKYLGVKQTQRGFNVYKFADENGNNVIAFSTGLTDETDHPMEKSYCYVLKATVKRHQVNDYEDNAKDTVVNRIIVLKKIGKKNED
jgi:hypothetical protein